MKKGTFTFFALLLFALATLAQCSGKGGDGGQSSDGSSPISPTADGEGIEGRNERAFFKTRFPKTASIVVIQDIVVPQGTAVTRGIVVTQGVGFRARKFELEEGVLSSPSEIGPELVQISVDGKVLILDGEPGIYEAQPVPIAAVTAGAEIPPAKVDTYCTGVQGAGYDELRVEAGTQGRVFIALASGKRDLIGGAGDITKAEPTGFTRYSKAGFGVLSIDHSFPNPDDSNFFQASFSTETPLPWKSLAPFWCHLNNVPVALTLGYQDQVALDAPIGYWRLGELSGTSAYDSSGNSYTGTAQNSVVWGPIGAIAGTTNTAASFNGVNQFISIPELPPFNFEYNNSFTVEAWIRNVDQSSNRMIVAKEQNSGNYTGYSLMVCESGAICPVQDVVAFHLQNTPTKYIQVFGSTPVNDSKWHHVVASYNGSGQASGVSIYIDGQLENMTVLQNALGNSTIQNSGPLAIGSRDLGGVPFKGDLDEVAIYNKVLSPERIASHYSLRRVFTTTTVTKDGTSATDLGGAGAMWYGSAVNAVIENGNAASSTGILGGQVTTPLNVKGFGFDIPQTAIVLGLQVDILRKGAGGCHDNAIYINDSDAGMSTGKGTSTPWAENYTYDSYGSASDLWSLRPTPAKLNNPDLSVQLSAYGPGDCYVDNVRMTAIYSN